MHRLDMMSHPSEVGRCCMPNDGLFYKLSGMTESNLAY